MKKSIKLNNLILVLLVFTSLQSCKKSVDYVAYNGNIYTVNNDFNVASAFAVKDGKFIDVGNDEIFSKYNTFVHFVLINMIMPLTNYHTHETKL